MAIRVTIRGVVFVCDTASEAREIAGIKGNSCDQTVAERKRQRGRPPGSKNGSSLGDAREAKKLVATVALLAALAKAGKRGITSEAVVAVMGLGGARGVGGAMRTAKRHVSEHGFDTENVVKTKGHPGDRRWIAGESLPEALARLERGDL